MHLTMTTTSHGCGGINKTLFHMFGNVRKPHDAPTSIPTILNICEHKARHRIDRTQAVT